MSVDTLVNDLATVNKQALQDFYIPFLDPLLIRAQSWQLNLHTDVEGTLQLLPPSPSTSQPNPKVSKNTLQAIKKYGLYCNVALNPPPSSSRK